MMQLRITPFWMVDLVVTIAIIGSSECAIKIWTADTNFNNPKNWKQQRIPCPRDRPVIKDPVAVYLSDHQAMAFKEMILPISGQLVFGNDVSLTITSDPVSTSDLNAANCKGEDMIFLGSKTRDWYDPLNWNVTTISNTRFSAALSSVSPIPDSEIIPCPYDHVIFPENSTFRVELDAPSVTVGELQIHKKNYTKRQLDRLIQTPAGNLLFDTTADIKVASTRCPDETGCSCGNDAPSVWFKICIHQERRCPLLQCLDPIQPIGQCCEICGAMLIMDYGSDFRFDLLQPVVEIFARKPSFNLVQAYMSKTFDGKIQIVMVDTDEEHRKAVMMAKALNDHLSRDNSEGPGLYGVENIKMLASTNYPSAINAGIGAGGIIGILLLLMLLAAGTVAGYMYFRKRRSSGFMFARFDTEGKIELELGTTPHEELDPSASAACKTVNTQKVAQENAFDNPMFDTPPQPATAFLAQSQDILRREESQSHTAIENPMFMVFDESSSAFSQTLPKEEK